MGLNFGNQLRGLGIKDAITLEALQQGLKEGLAGKRAPAAEQQRVQSFVRAAVDAAIDHNLSASQEFLARNGREPGIQSTASGLQYKVIEAGDADAASPGIGDEVTVQYRGRLLDGTEFDSSYANGRPATFSLAHVIIGWQEALVRMKPGAKWQVFIPPDLGYGKAPRPEIPGGSLLIFDVELLSVKRSAPMAPPPPPPQVPDPAKP